MANIRAEVGPASTVSSSLCVCVRVLRTYSGKVFQVTLLSLGGFLLLPLLVVILILESPVQPEAFR